MRNASGCVGGGSAATYAPGLGLGPVRGRDRGCNAGRDRCGVRASGRGGAGSGRAIGSARTADRVRGPPTEGAVALGSRVRDPEM